MSQRYKAGALGVGLAMLFSVSCSKTAVDESQDARLTKLEGDVSRLAKPADAAKVDATTPAGGPPDEIVADKLTAWRELFGGQVPISVKRGNITFAVSTDIPKETPIFPIRAEFPDGSKYELCLFKDGYREWQSFPKGHLDAGLR